MELYADELQAVFDKILSDALNASEATVDHNLQSNANKKAADDGGKVQYSKVGKLSNGNEVYETGINTSDKSYAEKIRIFKENFYSEDSPHYLGQKIAFEDNNGKIHLAEIDRHTQNENIDKINPGHLNQWDKAKINIGAEGDFVTLLQKSIYNSEKENKNKTKNDAHKQTKYFEYYLKTVIIDKKAFDVVINVRRESSGKKYVYEVKFNKAKESSQLAPQIEKFYNDRRAKVENTTRLSEPSSLDKVPQYKSKVNGKVQKSVSESDSISEADRKQLQLEIINENNPAPNTYNTWVRSVDDILTFEEALNDSDYEGYDDFTPDYDRGMAEEAIRTGKATVYSSYPIEPGVFVSMSRMEAASYSGNGKVYSKQISINDVAWLDPTQGQYAKVDTDNAGKIQKSAAYSTEFDRTQKKDSEGRRLSPLQMEYFADSVVRDGRGRLLPVYHGSKSAGFTIFSKSDDIGYFFARSLRTAETYSGSKQIFAPDRNSPEFEGAANYKVYLNITNPLIIEGKGAYWNNLEAIGDRVTLDVTCKSTGEGGACDVVIRMDVNGKTQKHTLKTTDDCKLIFKNSTF